MIEEHRAVDEERLNHLVSAVSELDVPKELIEALGAVAEGRRGYLGELGELLDIPIVMLGGARRCAVDLRCGLTGKLPTARSAALTPSVHYPDSPKDPLAPGRA